MRLNLLWNSTSQARFILLGALLLCQGLVSPYAHAQAEKLPKYDRQRALELWEQNQDRYLAEVFELNDLTTQQAIALEESQGRDALVAALEKGKIEIEQESGFGKATLIDGVPIVKVTHAESGLIFVMVPESTVAEDSQHLKTYIARQHLDNGRDVIVLWMNQTDPGEARSVTKIEKVLKPKLFSREFSRWWKEWWWASYKKPSTGDLALGVISGSAQAVLALGISWAKVALMGGSFDIEPALLSLGFGVPIGAYSSMYRNIVRRGPKWSQTGKSSIVSTAFAYTLVILTRDEGIRAITLTTAQGLALNGSLILNVIANNLAKNEWSQFNFMRDEMRLNTGKLKLELPGVEIKLPRASVEYQSMYLLPWGLRLPDLTGMVMPIPGSSVSLPLGKVLLWASLPFANVVNYLYAKKIGSPRAEKYEAKWARWKNPLKLIPHWTERTSSPASSRCAKLLDRQDSENEDP